MFHCSSPALPYGSETRPLIPVSQSFYCEWEMNTRYQEQSPLQEQSDSSWTSAPWASTQTQEVKVWPFSPTQPHVKERLHTKSSCRTCTDLPDQLFKRNPIVMQFSTCTVCVLFGSLMSSHPLLTMQHYFPMSFVALEHPCHNNFHKWVHM